MSIVEAIWYGDGGFASTARLALTPLSWLYGVGAHAHAVHQEHHRQPAILPTLAIGNVTVGGTGKTPVAAWAAARLRERGGAPAIVMRGYGDDEPVVHRQLNPTVNVIADSDRPRAIARARDEGADCIVLDDAFQQRGLARVADWVLVSAEQWRADLRLLPAGPLREPLSALGRADMVIVTRKASSVARAMEVESELERHVDSARLARCHLGLGALRSLRGRDEMPLLSVAGTRVLAIAAVGVPAAFFSQLRVAGASVDEAAFPDHHAFNAADVARLVQRARAADLVVCTLKDAVKLALLWPPATLPLWYVSQHLVIERGQDPLDHWLEAVLTARQAASSTAGTAGPRNSLHGHRSSTAD